MNRFDPAGPLPSGTAVLEASAGTGKTHAIAALATRYLADGLVAADRLAVISFSRIASAELRSRVRDRMRSTLDTLTRSLAGTLELDPDETDQLLLTGSRAEVEARLGNLRRAIAGLDAASIMTIHQFCQAMLDELGVLAEQDPQSTLVEDLSLTTDQVVDDLYLARYARHPQGPPFDLATARKLARKAVELPDAPLVPTDGLTERQAERLAFAAAVRAELAERKLRLGVYSFDDQLLRLRDSLRGGSPEARLGRLRRRCEVVLVDEFQDTDPVQWEILRAAFHGQVPLVLIGDPKQSIYAFRGADVVAYTDAVRAAGEQYSLVENHRADAGVVTAVNALFHNATLGEGIGVPPVTASHTTSRLVTADGSPWRAPVRLRCVPGDEPVRAAEARTRIIQDLTIELIGLLNGGVRVVDAGTERELLARDVAILVSTNQRGRQVAAALTGAGVPVAFSGADSIFATPAARDWLVLLRALEQPRRAAVRAAILTDFVGGDLTGLATADEEQFTAWAGTLQGWSRVLSGQGVAALFAAVQAANAPGGSSLAERVLRRPRGERDLTDYRHLAEILHAQHTDGLRGQALVAWLEEAVERGSATSDRLRRLETDRHAVQIMTVHKAKGLQFPVVLLPEAADLWVPDEDEDNCLAFHAGGRRVLDLGGRDARGRADRLREHAAEQAEDRLRSLYVAVTRAQSQLTMWWARTRATTEAAPLHRMLFRRRDRIGPPEPSYPLDAPPGDGHPGQLGWLAEAGIQVEDCLPATRTRLAPIGDRPERLQLASFDRAVDQLWRRTSYSGLTEAVHSRPPLALTSEPVVDDEPAAATLVIGAGTGVPSPMAELPGGAAFGSLVHQVLENLDWYAPTPDDEPALQSRLLTATTAAAERYPVPGVTPAALGLAMLPSLVTPLGRLTDGLPLAGIPVADRLSELNFEFALGTSTSRTTLREVADLLGSWLPADDPLAGYPEELAWPQLAGQALRGFLTGSIDSVLRIHSAAGPRFVVVDYKTNRLGPAELTLDHYAQPAMVAEMVRTHYPLQAILYCVALHRFLAARLPDYDPRSHLGGVGYLFVRGMGGRTAGARTGVFSWYPPAGLVTALSDLLADGGQR
ncbi:MAG: UvrD-helicase domain-containing protein [Propionibacteriaceae bacterium]|nr:UvrD-helicase domain-containing protein [Propionibacteriaceae bacterium]